MLERLARDKRSSLSRKGVTYGRTQFHNIGHSTYRDIFRFRGPGPTDNVESDAFSDDGAAPLLGGDSDDDEVANLTKHFFFATDGAAKTS
jgi:hypothetical protein